MDSILACLSRNMTLVSLENLEKFNALSSLAPKQCENLFILKEEINKIKFPVLQSTFWLSGSNEGENCDIVQKYSWCSAGVTFPAELESYWLSKVTTTVTNTTERCIAYKKNTSPTDTVGFLQKNCVDKYPFMCETNLTCPVQTCVVDVRFFSSFFN
jgi:hypothetical protein